MQVSSVDLLGREREVRWLLDRFEETTPRPLAVVIRGDPGIGKSSIWQAAVAELADRSWNVLKCRPTESEIQLSFSALGDLVDGLDADALQTLPPPQQRAIESILLRVDPEDSLLTWQGIHYAFVSVVRHLSTSKPVLIAIDDLQSLDASSEHALVSALRRLNDEPVAMLATIRSSREEKKILELAQTVGQSGFAILDLEPLSLEAIGEIIERRLDVILPRPLAVRVWHASGGNPFLAIEIARLLDREDFRSAGERSLPIPTGLDEVLGARLDRLSDAASQVSLVASALSRPTTQLIHSALPSAVASRGLIEVEERGILKVNGTEARFAHPLLASAVYARSSAEQLRQLHSRLADLVDDVEERTRHLALGAKAPDERVAASLAQAATTAYQRGAVVGAAELSDLAVTHTPPELKNESHRRSIDSAVYHLESGDADRARRTLETTIPHLESSALRSEALNHLAHVQFHDEDWPDSAKLCEAALAGAGDNPMIKLATLQHLTQILSALQDMRGALRCGEDALRLAHESGNEALIVQSRLVVATVEFMLGRGLDEDVMSELQDEDTWVDMSPAYIQPPVLYAVLLEWSDHFDHASARLRRLYKRALDYGNETAAAHILFHLSELETWVGDLRSAVRHGKESHRVATHAGHVSVLAFHTYAWALAEAHLGRVDKSRALANEGLEVARKTRATVAVVLNTAVLGFIELSLDRPAEAHELLAPLIEQLTSAEAIEPALFRILPNEIEALISCGLMDQAEPLLETFEQRARKLGRVSALAAGARCRGQLEAARGYPERAGNDFRRALEWHDKLTQHFERARTLLSLGVTERRLKRWASARATLQESLDVFENIGGALWAEKDRAQLGRLGGSSSDEGLTPTEQRIASLVSDGKSNRETAQALNLSVKTVESNLTRIYRKLGLRSRAQLAGHFAKSNLEAQRRTT